MPQTNTKSTPPIFLMSVSVLLLKQRWGEQLEFSVSFEAISLALVATFFYSAGGITSKYMVGSVKSSTHVLLLQMVINFIFLVVVAAGLLSVGFYDLNDFLDPKAMLVTAVVGLFTFAGLVTFYQGMATGDMSVGGVVLSAKVIFGVLIGFLFLGERFDLLIYVLILVVLVGVLLVSWEPNISLKNFFLFTGSGAHWFLVTIFLWAVGDGMVTALGNSYALIPLLLFRGLIILACLIPLYGWLNKRVSGGIPLRESLNRRTLGGALFMVFLLLTADFFFVYALGMSLTLSQAMGTLEGVMVFFMVLALSQSLHLRERLGEPIDRQTITIRFVGVVVSTVGAMGIIFA